VTWFREEQKDDRLERFGDGKAEKLTWILSSMSQRYAEPGHVKRRQGGTATNFGGVRISKRDTSVNARAIEAHAQPLQCWCLS
jgi:hypothetical protein